METNKILNRILERETCLKEVAKKIKEDIGYEEKDISFDDSFFKQLQSGQFGEKLNILESLDDEDIILMIALIDFVENHTTVNDLSNNITTLKRFFSRCNEEERQNQVSDLFQKRGVLFEAINHAYYYLKNPN